MKMGKIVGVLLLSGWMNLAASAAPQQILVEAESFADHGGWSLDTQFIHIMGSPYLLAHGLGEPVQDPTTAVKFPSTGTYKVFVRTKDWVARWKAPGAPGKFQLLVDGKPLAMTFGTKGAEWFWHDGGTVEITKPETTLALHDLTGFEGRCDAILFSKDAKFWPPNDSKPLAAWRKQLLGLPEKPVESGPYDFVVIGGGYAGMGAAVAAARLGCKVALIQDRPVLGGNGSGEIRVWPQGGTRRGPFPTLGEIIDELADHPKVCPDVPEAYEDAKREAVCRAETHLSLFLNHYVFAAETDGKRIVSVTALNTRTSEERRFNGKLFADCTGHAWVGVLAGADHTVKEEGHMGMSNMWRWKQTDSPQPFPKIDWALDLTMDDFPYPKRNGEWFWESGFNKHPIADLELTRDWNFRAVYGAWNAMKNHDPKNEHTNAKLEWLAFIGGTRESRQLLGDVVLTREDVTTKRPFPDACVPSTWDIDLHYPKEQFAKKFPDNPFISKAIFDKAVDRTVGYPVPYRCFYSRNIENLFMAGRCASVTHEALGTVRVMKTGGMMGEVAGKAASICVAHNCTPRDVYQNYFDELKELMNLRGIARRDSLDGKIYIPANAKPLPPPSDGSVEATGRHHDPAKLPGIIIDDAQAILIGPWSEAGRLDDFIGRSYRYIGPKGKGSARFEFTVPTTGRYEVRFGYQAHENRATNTLVTVHSADGDKTTRINQRLAPTIPPTFVSLGVFRFESDQRGAVEITNDKANGNVTVDAVQVLPAQ